MANILNSETVKVGDVFTYGGEEFTVTGVGTHGVQLSDGYTYDWTALAFMNRKERS